MWQWSFSNGDLSFFVVGIPNLGGGRGVFLVTFILFLACSFLGMILTIYHKDVVMSQEGYLLNVKFLTFLHFKPFSQKLISHLFSLLAWNFSRIVPINSPRWIWLKNSKSSLFPHIDHLIKNLFIWLNHSKGHFQCQKGQALSIFT